MEDFILLDIKDREKLLVNKSTLEKYKVVPCGEKESHPLALIDIDTYNKLRESSLSIFKARKITKRWYVELKKEAKC